MPFLRERMGEQRALSVEFGDAAVAVPFSDVHGRLPTHHPHPLVFLCLFLPLTVERMGHGHPFVLLTCQA